MPAQKSAGPTNLFVRSLPVAVPPVTLQPRTGIRELETPSPDLEPSRSPPSPIIVTANQRQQTATPVPPGAKVQVALLPKSPQGLP